MVAKNNFATDCFIRNSWAEHLYKDYKFRSDKFPLSAPESINQFTHDVEKWHAWC